MLIQASDFLTISRPTWNCDPAVYTVCGSTREFLIIHCLLSEEEHSNSVSHIAALITHHGIRNLLLVLLFILHHTVTVLSLNTQMVFFSHLGKYVQCTLNAH